MTTTLKRLPDWRPRLGRIIDSAREVPFQWGMFDCALHVSNCIRAMTGCSDPAATFRGKYSDEAGAAAIYGPSLQQFIASQAQSLGFPEIPVTLARRGDVVFVDNATPQGCVGVVSLDGRYVSCAGEKGIVMVTIDRWRRAWRVG